MSIGLHIPNLKASLTPRVLYLVTVKDRLVQSLDFTQKLNTFKTQVCITFLTRKITLFKQVFSTGLDFTNVLQ